MSTTPADQVPTSPPEPEATLPMTPDVEPAEAVEVEPAEPEAPLEPAVLEPAPNRLAIEESEPEALPTPDLDAVESSAPVPSGPATSFDMPAPAQPGAATNLDLPSIELPHPIPEPTPPPQPPAPPATSGGVPYTGGDYAQNLAQSSYGQPSPQPAPVPPPPPAAPYAPTPYGTPSAQGQQPHYAQPGYPQQLGYGLVPVPGLSLSEESTWSSAAHWSSLLAGLISLPFLGPLLVMLIQGPKSARVRANAVESLNFDLTMVIAMIACFLLSFVVIGVFLIPVVAILWFILKIVAAVQTSQGNDYRYPFSIRMVK
ncbi:MAG: DUF4870 domain-containing protein [Actinobacteria bacterium]|nr:DUF4870 domain-containing protein [Actinomycetota bacterium]